jgi:hypothetical protein
MKWLKKVAATPLESVARVIDSLTSENERINAPSIRAVKEAVDDGWLKIYPIGSIYMNVTNVDPATLFGGTWVQIEDTFLLACGQTYENEETGGSATHTPSGTVGNHTLTVNEIPNHTHNYYFEDTPTTTQSGLAYAAAGQSALVWSEKPTSAVGSGQAHNHSFTGTSQNTMPTYLAVYVWKRTA